MHLQRRQMKQGLALELDKAKEEIENQYSELVVVSGSVYNSFINVLSQGISVHDFLRLDDLSPL
jgi:hypothetical protein